MASQRDPALDGLRGVAILLVFLFHYGGGLRAHQPAIRFFGYATQLAWIGVELFFVLSGFLITGLLLDSVEQHRPIRSFFRRRALRILPLYLAVLGVAAICAFAAGATSGQLQPLLVYAAFLQNIPPLQQIALKAPPPLSLHHLWSLAVEEQFYLLWPLLILCARKPRRVLHLCFWLFVLSGLLREAIAGTPQGAHRILEFATLLPVRAGGLALGGALTCMRRLYADHTLLRPLRLLTLVGLLAFLVTGLLTRSFLLNSRASFTFGLAAVDLSALGLTGMAVLGTFTRRTLSRPVLGFLGRISYGFYVLHILLEPWFDHLGVAFSHHTSGFSYQTTRLLLAFPLTVAAAWLSFIFLERPFLRLAHRSSSVPHTSLMPSDL